MTAAMLRQIALLAAVAPLLLANASPDPQAAPIPPAIQAMLDAAMASGNEGEVATIAKYARAAAPASADAIAKVADHWQSERREASTRRIREGGFFELVKGRVELGAWLTTGNSDNVGLNAVVDLKREGLNWRHKLRLQADYQRTNDVTSREHYLAAYEPNFKIDDRAYIYGAAQYESDRFLGFSNRYSSSSGLGYSALKNADVTLDVELGPAFRATDFTDGTDERRVAGRGSLDFDWRLSPGFSFSQDASAYVQSANSTLAAKSAIRAKLIGPLSAQLSYALQFESDPPDGRQTTDTTARGALVVDF